MHSHLVEGDKIEVQKIWGCFLKKRIVATARFQGSDSQPFLYPTYTNIISGFIVFISCWQATSAVSSLDSKVVLKKVSATLPLSLWMRVEVESFGTLKAHLICLYSSQTSKKGVYRLPAAFIIGIATRNHLYSLLILIMSSSSIDKMFEITLF